MEAVVSDGIGDVELFCTIVEAGGRRGGRDFRRCFGARFLAVSRRLSALEERLVSAWPNAVHDASA
jgi:hypothetical protein